MFKVKQKVIYPVYGMGEIDEVYMEQIGENSVQYYKINLPHSLVEVSVPVEHAERLGLRAPSTKKDLLVNLEKLGDRVKLDEDTVTNFDDITNELVRTGEINDVIQAMNLFYAFSKKKEKEGKPVAFTYTQRQEKAVKFLRSIVEAMLGEKAVAKYGLEE